MSDYDLFIGKLNQHLSKYNIWGAGTYQNNGRVYPHIANIDGREQEDVVRAIIESDGVPADLYRKPHPCAHHMNSSQVVCYEFFRPMMTVDANNYNFGYDGKRLVELVKETIGVSISEGAKCFFEYEDKDTRERFKTLSKDNPKGEKSQFYFFIEDGKTEIFFEIKYTEQSFGGWTRTKKTSQKSINNHCAYVEKGYKLMLLNSPFITQDFKDEMLSIKDSEFSNPKISFNKYYQLFRNALKADNTKYSIFIFPAANPGPQKEFDDFNKYLVKDQNHIIILYWECLTTYMSEAFCAKFIQGLK